VTGTLPSAIPSNIGILYNILTGEKADDLPSANFRRQCRQVVQVLGETMTAMKLSEAPKEMWKQIFFDATTRHQTPFQAVIIGLLGEDGILDPVIVSSCIFLEDKSAETTVDNMIEKIESLKHQLTRLKEVMDDHCPNLAHLVPNPDGIDLKNFKKLCLCWILAQRCKKNTVFLLSVLEVLHINKTATTIFAVYIQMGWRKNFVHVYKSSSKILSKRLIQNCKCLVSTVHTAVPTTNSLASVATTPKGRAKTLPYISASTIRECVCFISRAPKVHGKTSL